jgi:putative transposase
MSERGFGRTAGGVCWVGLHVVWCPKYRRRIVGGRVARRCGELVELIAGECGWQIVANEVMADHVDLFVRVGPTECRRWWWWRSRAAPRGC